MLQQDDWVAQDRKISMNNHIPAWTLAESDEC